MSSIAAPAPAGTDLLAIARDYAQRPDDWPLAPRWDPVSRWYHRLDAHPDFEVWLLTWLPGQATELHDHGPSAGAFVVVTGELLEETFRGTELARRTLAEGRGRAFPRDHVHRIMNLGDRPAVSLHVYGPALQTMTRYRLESGRLVATAIDQAGVAW